MNEDLEARVRKFAEELGMEYETRTPFDKIWDYVVSLLAAIGLLFCLAVVVVMCTGVKVPVHDITSDHIKGRAAALVKPRSDK